ncbi:MAG TPA: hypothetical protein VM328_00600 [Fimbriimonadaceae bacterium]|jgi:hypothetical protein|nr:hypothetical protein [Fimbriimonadaceae bacterium]
MRYSVGMRCEGDKVMSHDEILELADAVAMHNGIATGIGQESYGAMIVVDAENPGEAEVVAKEHFRVAVQQAGLPAWPIAEVETLSEEDDLTPEM